MGRLMHTTGEVEGEDRRRGEEDRNVWTVPSGQVSVLKHWSSPRLTFTSPFWEASGLCPGVLCELRGWYKYAYTENPHTLHTSARFELACQNFPDL